MKTKELIKELKRIKIDHTDMDEMGFNGLCSQEIDKIVNIFEQAISQTRQELIGEIKSKLSFYRGEDEVFGSYHLTEQEWEDLSHNRKP